MGLPLRSGVMQLWSWGVLLAALFLGGVGLLAWAEGAWFLGILGILQVLLGFFLMERTVGVLDWARLNLSGFFFASFLLLVLSPSFLVAWDKPDPFRERFLLSVSSGAVTVPFGVLLANLLFRSGKGELYSYYHSPIQGEGPLLRTFFLFLGLGCLVVTIHVFMLRELPLLEMIRTPGSWERLSALRESFFTSLEPPLAYFFALVRDLLFPVLVSVALAKYLTTRRSLWFFVFWFTLAVAAFYALLSTAKGPVALLLMVVAFTAYLCRAGKVRFPTLLLTAALVLLPSTLILFMVVPSPEVGFWKSAEILLVHRLFFGPNEVAYEYFATFPEQVDFLGGLSMGKVAWLFGSEPFNVGLFMARKFNPGAPESASAGGMFLASFYSDFGLPGVVLGGVATGLIIQSIQIHIFRRAKTPVRLSQFAFLFYAFWMLTSRSLPVVLLSTGVLFVLMLPWAFSAVDRFFLLPKQRQQEMEGVP